MSLAGQSLREPGRGLANGLGGLATADRGVLLAYLQREVAVIRNHRKGHALKSAACAGERTHVTFPRICCLTLMLLIAAANAPEALKVSARPIERDQGRSMVISQSGIVASESPLASQAGAAILARGGNAIDAAVATHAVMTVVAPMWDGIGGDLFAIVYDAKSGKFYGLNASGWAPAAQSLERLRQKGFHDTPQRGIRSATVPGAVDGWQKLLDRFGKKKMDEVLAPAIDIAQNGYPVTEWIAMHFAADLDLIRANKNAAHTYLISGRPARVGESAAQPGPGLVVAADRAGRTRRVLPGQNHRAASDAFAKRGRSVHGKRFCGLFERMGRAHFDDLPGLDGL